MNRILTTVNMGGDLKKYRVTFMGEKTPFQGQEATRQLALILRTIADQPTTALCGGMPFQTLKAFYAAGSWTVECEAQTEEESPGR